MFTRAHSRTDPRCTLKAAAVEGFPLSSRKRGARGPAPGTPQGPHTCHNHRRGRLGCLPLPRTAIKGFGRSLHGLGLGGRGRATRRRGCEVAGGMRQAACVEEPEHFMLEVNLQAGWPMLCSEGGARMPPRPTPPV